MRRISGCCFWMRPWSSDKCWGVCADKMAQICVLFTQVLNQNPQVVLAGYQNPSESAQALALPHPRVDEIAIKNKLRTEYPQIAAQTEPRPVPAKTSGSPSSGEERTLHCPGVFCLKETHLRQISAMHPHLADHNTSSLVTDWVC